MPRVEDSSNRRKDSSYPLVSSVVSMFDDALPLGGSDRTFATHESPVASSVEPRCVLVSDVRLEMQPDDVVWVPVHRVGLDPDPGSSEAVLPVKVLGKEVPEAVPGIWTPGEASGLICVVAPTTGCFVSPGDVLAELASGAAVATGCSCGVIDMSFTSAGEICEECKFLMSPELHPCRGCFKVQPALV